MNNWTQVLAPLETYALHLQRSAMRPNLTVHASRTLRQPINNPELRDCVHLTPRRRPYWWNELVDPISFRG
jgi:hypothetical protein